MNNVINELDNASDVEYVNISDDYAALESVISALFAFLDDRQYDISADDSKEQLWCLLVTQNCKSFFIILLLYMF